MASQRAATTDAPNVRTRALCTALRCPPLPKRRVIDLPFEEEGDSVLLARIMRDTPMSVSRSMVPPAYGNVPAPAHVPTHPRPQAPPATSPAVSGVVISAHRSAHIMLSQQADVSSSAPRRQSPSPARATRRERQGFRSPSRASTLSSPEDISSSPATRNGFKTGRRTSDSSLSSLSSSS